MTEKKEWESERDLKRDGGGDGVHRNVTGHVTSHAALPGLFRLHVSAQPANISQHGVMHRAAAATAFREAQLFLHLFNLDRVSA